MIKKRYYILLLFVVLLFLFSSLYVYNVDYVFKLKETESLLENISKNEQSQYDKLLKQLDYDISILTIEFSNLTDEKETLEAFEKVIKESVFIENFILINKDGRFLSVKEEPLKWFEKVWRILKSDSEYSQSSLISSGGMVNVYYYPKVIYSSNGDKLVLLSGLNIEEINTFISEGRFNNFNTFDIYIYLISNEGDILYHPSAVMQGLNYFEDVDEIKSKSGLSLDSYNEIKRSLLQSKKTIRNEFFNYKSFGSNKIVFANSLETFDVVLFTSADQDRINKSYLKVLLRNILPIFTFLILSTYVWLSYIYIVKYTDYFTETENERSFRCYLNKIGKQTLLNQKCLVLKIESISYFEKEISLNDENIFYEISSHLKELSPFYKKLFRLSRVHYVLNLEDNLDSLKMRTLLAKIKGSISIKGDVDKFIRGKIMCLNLEERKMKFSYNEIDNRILHDMDDYYEGLNTFRLKKFVDYEDVLEKQEEMARKLVLIEDLIENRKIMTYFQPIVNLTTGEILKYEVLMRVNPEDSPINHIDIIEIAEAYNLIEKLDQYIVHQSFEKCHSRMSTLGEELKLSINLSAKSINDLTYKYILDKAKLFSLNPENITFELTETVEIERYDQIAMYINQLRYKGFKMAIDDFGTGYAHVELLSRIDVDYVKIDGFFVRNCEKDKRKLKTLSALVYIAQNYDVEIIAEQIENLSTIDIIKKMGVKYGQGYYFGKPKDKIIK